MKSSLGSYAFYLVTLAALGLAPIVSATAGSIKTPVGQKAAENHPTSRPVRGITKTKVEQQYGKPSESSKTVGQPPISSWIYQEFTVYFEYDRVIHSVLHTD